MTYNRWAIGFEDRLLAHLHLVIMQQLRAQQSFAMSWINSPEDGDGRGSIWIHPAGDLSFRFEGSRHPDINRDWIATLTDSSRSSQGLIVTTEDGKLARSREIKRL